MAIAGGVKNLPPVLDNVTISKKLHDIKTAVLINHEDCGAYGAEGTTQRHTTDLRDAAAKIKEQTPELNVETYYLHLDGTFEEVS